MRGSFPFAAIAVVAVLLAGCSSRDVPLELSWKGLRDPVPGGNGRHVVLVIPFRDERPDPARCGMRTDIFGSDSADAICRTDPNEWFARIFAEELRASGFAVVNATEDAPPGALRIEGSLLQFFVEPIRPGRVEADLSVRLHVTSASGLDATRTFFVKGWKRALTAGSGGYYLSVQRATGAMLEEMVEAVVGIMDEFPQLGVVGGRSEHATRG